MTKTFVVPIVLVTLFVALPASAQSSLSLSEAIARAKAHNPDAGSAAAPSGKRQAPSTKSAPAGNVTTGQQLFMKKSCYYSHGTEGQGSIAGVGPRVALVARSFDSFSRYVRRPTGRMTAYSEKILSDTELSDIYAFLRSLPAARAVSDIPLLEQLRKR